MLMMDLATGAIETDGRYAEVSGEVEGLKTSVYFELEFRRASC